MTERTIIADQTTCPRCCSVDSFELYIVNDDLFGKCDCGCKFTFTAKVKIESTEVRNEPSK